MTDTDGDINLLKVYNSILSPDENSGAAPQDRIELAVTVKEARG